MSTLIRNLKTTAIASVGAVAILAAGVTGASADHKRHGHGWHGNGKKTVVIHKHNGGKKVVIHKRSHHKKVVVHHHHRPAVRKVVHIHKYEQRPHYKRRPVRVIHHHHNNTPRRSNIGFDNRTGGAIIGALLGAAGGTQFGKGRGRTVAILTGTVIGAVIGGKIGQDMDRADHAQVQNTLENTPTGQPVAWKNPDNGNQYTVTPTRTYRTGSNVNCRDYDAWVFIDGYEQKVTGTACRRPDGTWQQVQS